MNNQEVPQGYKKTKVGVIPFEWEVVNIEDIADVKGGKRLPKGYNLTEEVTPFPYIRVTNMSMGGINNKQILYVPLEIQHEIKNYIISKDDLYIAVAGNTLGMVGDIPNHLNNANLTENADKLCNIKINKNYLLFILMSSLIQNKIKSEITTNAQPKLALTRIKTFKIPLPPLKEQQKIAKILTTWDDAISKQEKLIKAKEQLKKGLIQKLLSGEVRFDEFSDEWKEIPLKEVLKERKTYSEKGLEFVHVSLTKEGVVPKSDRYERDFLVKDDNKKYKITYLNDICYNPANLKFGVICKNTLGTAIFSPIYITFELNKNYNIDFFGYLLTTNDFINRVRKYEQGTVYERMAVSPKDFLSYKLKLPSQQEQKKIVQVLNTADKEIELLKNELESLKEQKKGLMQKLLTGEARVEV